MTKITGYRTLTDEEVRNINQLKDAGSGLERIVWTLRQMPGVDQRWVSIGETHLQQGMMALTRAIAKPENF